MAEETNHHNKPPEEGLVTTSAIVLDDGDLPVERFYYEINLLQLEGFLFCLDPRAAKRQIEPLNLADARKRPVTITPNPLYGRPSVLAYKVSDGIMKKLSDYGRPVPTVVSFSKRELARMVGRSWAGAKTSKELFAALMQLQATQISASFCVDSGKDEWVLVTFGILPEVLVAGTKTSLDSCSVKVNPHIVRSLEQKHYRCINHDRMAHVDGVARQLYKRIYHHFCNLYKSVHKAEELHIRKDYGSICRTWLGGLKELRYKSKIEQEQLGVHLRAIRYTGLIRKCEIEKNVAGDGFNVVLWPGKGFFEDYIRFYESGDQGQFQFGFAADHHEIAKPLDAVAYFYKRLHRVEELKPTLFSPKDTDFAKTLLAIHTEEEVHDFIEFGLGRAEETKFPIKTMGGLKACLPEWEAIKEYRKKAKLTRLAADRADRDERLKNAYEGYRRQAIRDAANSLSEGDRGELEHQSEAEWREKNPKPSHFDGLGTRLIFERLVAERIDIPNFETWLKASEVGGLTEESGRSDRRKWEV